MATRDFTVPGGKTRTLRVRFNKRAITAVRRYKRLQVRVTAKLVGARTTRRTITVRR
jgi:hypothetical protein